MYFHLRVIVLNSDKYILISVTIKKSIYINTY